MKSERRHELQQNILAGWLTQCVDWTKAHSKTLVVVAIAAFVVWAGYLAYRVVSSRMASRRSEGWDEYYAAIENNDEADLKRIADENPGTSAGLWARLTLGDLHLIGGIGKLYSNPSSARQELDEAISDYLHVVNESDEPMQNRRGLYGLARAFEARFQIPQAIERYKELADKWPDSALGKVARRRAEYLRKPATKKFLAWFSRQELDPPFSAFDRPKVGGSKTGRGLLDGLNSSPFDPLEIQHSLGGDSSGIGFPQPSDDDIAPSDATDKPGQTDDAPDSDSAKPGDEDTTPKKAEQPTSDPDASDSPTEPDRAEQPAGDASDSPTEPDKAEQPTDDPDASDSPTEPDKAE